MAFVQEPVGSEKASDDQVICHAGGLCFAIQNKPFMSPSSVHSHIFLSQCVDLCACVFVCVPVDG